ncbi:family 10 glycosylhydrolase [Micromonospora sp. PSH03]|uniref:glycoside hydrolase family 10 protein n=1 Tax=Micromonospora salmantinae TaxID=2911211 RepID=UPI001EE8C1E6|nr:family 10 glycosylhydrolase [Micromonospora salmantinae]MCG5456046.1 family 10 glycosylhydrolase [Micromonospora salmantinae]
MKATRLGVTGLIAALLGTFVTATPASAAPSAADTTGTATCATDPATPKRQFRAMWISSVVNIDWPSKASQTNPDRIAAQQAEYRELLDLAGRLHHNAVVVQVRPTADALWPSPYEPWSEYLTGVRGQDPGWDPLAFLVDESHKRNLEFHAWFNPYRVSMPAPGGAGADLTQLAPGHPAQQHPDWTFAYPPAGVAGSRLYYNPGIPEVREFVQTAMMDAVKRYDIDGVHFDDYFYPYPSGTYQVPDDATFAAHNRGFTDRADWRRDNINLLIQEMNGKIKAAKPWVKFGVSPFGIWRNKTADPLGSDTTGSQSYDIISADTRKWIKQEWIDYVVPQLYWYIGQYPAADYARLVPWWAETVRGTRVQLYIGQADYKSGDPAYGPYWQNPRELSDHLTLNRSHPEVQGNVHFSAVQVRANRLGATDIYAGAHYSRPALVPAMPHLPARPLLFPVVSKAIRQADGVRLTWRQPADGVGPLGTATSYAIYRFDGTTLPGRCATADAAHLVGTVRAAPGNDQSWVDTSAEPGRRYTYRLTALDRSANESPASPPAFVCFNACHQ